VATPEPAATAALPSASAAASAEPAEAIKVTLAIRTVPPTATIVLDGQTVANPYRAEVSKDNARHTLQVSARGFAAEQTAIAYDRAQDMVVTLNRAAGNRAPIVTAPRPTSLTEGDVLSPAPKKPKRTLDDKDPYQ
jgi:hypothetical protein